MAEHEREDKPQQKPPTKERSTRLHSSLGVSRSFWANSSCLTLWAEFLQSLTRTCFLLAQSLPSACLLFISTISAPKKSVFGWYARCSSPYPSSLLLGILDRLPGRGPEERSSMKRDAYWKDLGSLLLFGSCPAIPELSCFSRRRCISPRLPTQYDYFRNIHAFR